MCRTIITLFLSTYFSFSVLAQPLQTPYFKSKEDSTLFASIDARVKTLFKSGFEENRVEIDSLLRKQMALRSKIAGYRYTYTPTHKTIGQLNPSEYRSITELSITKANKIPAEVYQLKNLKNLEIVTTSIKRIPRKLNRLTNLESLTILKNTTSRGLKLGKNSHIKTLTIRTANLPLAYSRFKALEKLNLSGNDLDKFPSLKGLKKLKELNLSGNQLANIETANFQTATSIRSIELQGNKIERIPASFSTLTNLKKLMLNYNQAKEIDPACSTLQSLEQLGLYQNKLTAIPDCLYELKSIKEIDLYYNQIEKIDSRVTNWKKLEILYLSHNKLFAVPDNMGEMTELKELYLSNNRLTTLPSSISELSSLKVLRANNNRLFEAPDYLLKLNNIENIDISSNSLVSMNTMLLDKPALKLVILKSNPWDEETKNKLSGKAAELKSRGIIIHLQREDDEPLEEGKN